MGGRFVPYGWSAGQSSSAVLGSLTRSRMRPRMYSEMVSLDSLLVSTSPYVETSMRKPPPWS